MNVKKGCKMFSTEHSWSEFHVNRMTSTVTSPVPVTNRKTTRPAIPYKCKGNRGSWFLYLTTRLSSFLCLSVHFLQYSCLILLSAPLAMSVCFFPFFKSSFHICLLPENLSHVPDLLCITSFKSLICGESSHA